jgi:putative flippase GtrA
MSLVRDEINLVVRFALAGGINTAVAYVVFASLLFLGVHFTLATLLGGIAGVIVGFQLMSSWVFRVRIRQRFWRFCVLFGLAYMANIGVQAAILSVGLLNGYLAGAVGTAGGALLAYVGNRYWVFAY